MPVPAGSLLGSLGSLGSLADLGSPPDSPAKLLHAAPGSGAGGLSSLLSHADDEVPAIVIILSIIVLVLIVVVTS